MPKKQKEPKKQDEHAKDLEDLMESLQSRFGEGAIMKLGDTVRTKVETIPSGSFSLDIALGGGIPKGRIVEIYGPEGSGKTTLALTIAAETHDLKRFVSARALMGYTGLVSSEESSGETVRRGRITKVGNAHLRRVLVEAAWTYHRGAATGTKLRERRKGCPAEVVAIAQKAQERLSRKYNRMVGKGKCHQKAVVAVARELAGFVWATGQLVPMTMAA